MLSLRRHNAPGPESTGRGTGDRSRHLRTGASRSFVAVALLAPALLVTAGFATNGDLRVIPTVLADPLSLFTARSPGPRNGAALTQTKPRRQPQAEGQDAPLIRKPGRQTSVVRPPRLIVEPVPTFEPLDLGEGDPIEGVAFVPGVQGTTGAGGPASPVAVAGEGSVPGAFPIPPLPQPGMPPPEVTGTVPAAPEPEGWLMMLTGFFLIGCTLRYRRLKNPSAYSR